MVLKLGHFRIGQKYLEHFKMWLEKDGEDQLG
jgi:hypothetical protein